jgi:hypothetical protein
MWVEYDHRTMHFFWKKNNATVTWNKTISHCVSVVVNSLLGSSLFNMVTSKGIGYTYYTSCQFGHHKGRNHFYLGVHEKRIFQAWKSVMLWDICVPEIHFSKYSLYRHVSEMELFNEICILAYQSLLFPPLFNYQHALHYIPEGWRQHGSSLKSCVITLFINHNYM